MWDGKIKIKKDLVKRLENLCSYYKPRGYESLGDPQVLAEEVLRVGLKQLEINPIQNIGAKKRARGSVRRIVLYILYCVGPGGITAADLSRMVGIKPTNIYNHLRGLEAGGFVIEMEGGTVKRVGITDEGAQRVRGSETPKIIIDWVKRKLGDLELDTVYPPKDLGGGPFNRLMVDYCLREGFLEKIGGDYQLTPLGDSYRELVKLEGDNE